MMGEQPEVQVIANLVVLRSDGRVLLVRHDPDGERWWLPGEDLRPYQHPDERAREVLDELGVLTLPLPLDDFRGVVSRTARVARRLPLPSRRRGRSLG